MFIHIEHTTVVDVPDASAAGRVNRHEKVRAILAQHFQHLQTIQKTQNKGRFSQIQTAVSSECLCFIVTQELDGRGKEIFGLKCYDGRLI